MCISDWSSDVCSSDLMNRTLLFTALLAAGGMMHANVAHADATINIVNLDEGTGQGLDDPTPATPIGGNPGTTRGEQAQIVFQFEIGRASCRERVCQNV